MHPYLEIARLHSDTYSSRVAHGALPDAPVQPHRQRRRLGRRVRTARQHRSP